MEGEGRGGEEEGVRLSENFDVTKDERSRKVNSATANREISHTSVEFL